MIRPFLVLATVLAGDPRRRRRGRRRRAPRPRSWPSRPTSSRGPGFYLNLYKFVPVVLIYLLWTWTTDWVEHDTKELNNVKFALWNSVDLLLRGARA